MVSLENYRKVFLSLTVILIVLGFLVLISASSIIGAQQYNDILYFVKKQLIQGLLLGIILAFLAFKIDIYFWRKISFLLLLISIIFLILCFVPGFERVINGAHRWIKLGPILFQPSELLKITVIVFLAHVFDKYRNEPLKKIFNKTFIIYLCVLAIIGFLLTIQPSTGTFVIISISTLIIYFYNKITLKQFLILILLGVIFFTILIIKYQYRLERILTFTNPHKDPKGKGYQIIQSLIGIGTGGLFGKGFGNSVQKFNYLPESHTDAIFSIIAEEFGFIGSLILIIIYLLFITTGLKLAKYTNNYFGQLIILGFVTSIGLQAFINIAALCHLIPLTGIPLPFISYGSTAYVVNLIQVGIIMNITKKF
ncbi:MAG: putative lipid II flippase FtsW [Minisyncoccia bacterium]